MLLLISVTGDKDTGVISGSHHYLGEDKATKVSGGLSQLISLPLIVATLLAEASCRVQLGTFSHGGGALRTMSPDHKGDAHLTRAFFHLQRCQKKR